MKNRRLTDDIANDPVIWGLFGFRAVTCINKKTY